jgi:hypothetical protein
MRITAPYRQKEGTRKFLVAACSWETRKLLNKAIKLECSLTENTSRMLKEGEKVVLGILRESLRIFCWEVNDFSSADKLHNILAKDHSQERRSFVSL